MAAARLSGKHRVIWFDLPGHGLTGPAPGFNYTRRSVAAATHKLIAKLSVERGP
jgi:pimeloyl-ACP methyl ester carboxylesterase